MFEGCTVTYGYLRSQKGYFFCFEGGQFEGCPYFEYEDEMTGPFATLKEARAAAKRAAKIESLPLNPKAWNE